MNVHNLDTVNALWKAHKYWSKVKFDYQNNNLFLCVDLKNNGGTRYSLNDLMAYDTSKDGPTAAIICQAFDKQIKTIEENLVALGVKLYGDDEPQLLQPGPCTPKRP